MRYLNRYSLIFVFAVSSCVEPFNPKFDSDNQEFLVVDGMITDQQGPYTVKITTSSLINAGNESISVTNIFIEDDDGGVENLIEVSAGIYQTVALQGEAGKSYRLNFEYKGDKYQSTWERINESSVIDGIDYSVETRGTTDVDVDYVGVQFFINNHGTNDGQRYFRFEWEETWKIGVSMQIELDYLGHDNSGPTTSNLPQVCWKYNNPVGINLATTENLTKNQLFANKLGFMRGDDGEERFSKRYSLLVKQYTISEDEYLFWKGIKESNEEIGGLFDKQPGEISGNLINVSNTENVVLGYFSASGLTEKRIFLNTSDVPNANFNLRCHLKSWWKDGFDSPSEYEDALTFDINSGLYYFKNFIYENEEEKSGRILGARIVHEKCVDCTAKGGDINKPSFWYD